MGPIVVTQLAAGLSVLAGAVLVKSMMDQSNMMAGPFPRCPSSDISGWVACFCSSWSDGDVGCRSCFGSGQMPCNNCCGSSTDRPLPVRLTSNYRPPPTN